MSEISYDGMTIEKMDNICMWYRHDFGLLDKKEKDKLRYDLILWVRALSKEGMICQK